MSMQEQQGKEKAKENKDSKEKKKKTKLSKEKKFYLFTAIGCAAVLVAIIVVAIAVSNAGSATNQGANPPSSESTLPDEPDEPSQPDKPDEPVSGETEGMILPVASVNISNEYGFFHNQTLNNYYVHTGVDFATNVGAEVFAVEDGVVESIYKDDILLGTEIVLNHGNGLKSVYRFVTEAEGLKVGAEVKKGDVIATVAEATGNEYKDGAHLHFEIMANGESVDPTLHLTLEEK